MSVDLSPPGRVGVAGASVARGGWRVPTDVWLVVALTVIGAALRFATIASQSFWFDEAQAVHEMRLSFGGMWHLWSTHEPNPPLYFVIAWPWAKLFGTGELGIRSLSAVLGTVTVPLVYLCGRELVSRRAGALAAAFAALNPFLIWYSQEAREYMLLAALSAASLLFFARVWHARGRRDLLWWAIFSGLALATQYFAGFLVAAEALALLYRARNRATIAAVGAQMLVQAALIPHLVSHISHPKGWIDVAGLSVRIQQVPVAFAFNTLYKGPSALSYSLLGAAMVTGLLITLLIVGASGAELRGAGIAAALAGSVLLVPLAVALVGHDYYEARALIPGWIPLAVVVGAACAASGTRVIGAGFALLLCAAFVYAGIKIDDGSSTYRRPDWNGVAAALGPTSTTRAIVAYDGTFATAPLAIHLRGVPWTGSGQDPQDGATPVTVGELDIVGDQGQSLATRSPPETSLISTAKDDVYLVDRFRLTHPLRMTPAALGRLATTLLGPELAVPSVLIQYGSP